MISGRHLGPSHQMTLTEHLLHGGLHWGFRSMRISQRWSVLLRKARSGWRGQVAVKEKQVARNGNSNTRWILRGGTVVIKNKVQ